MAGSTKRCGSADYLPRRFDRFAAGRNRGLDRVPATESKCHRRDIADRDCSIAGAFPRVEPRGCFRPRCMSSWAAVPTDDVVMPLADFVHLRTHSAYSLSSGAIKIKELVQLCRAEAMPAVAITDSGNLFGALEFATACSDAGVQPIIGVEIALAPGENVRGQRLANGHAATGRNGEPDRIVLLV